MKHLKLLIGLVCIVGIIASIVLLYRRTNILLSHFDNLNNDLRSIKSLLSQGSKVKTPQVSVKNPSGPRINVRPVNVRPVNVRPETPLVVNKPENNIINTRNNIEQLRASIEEIEDMMTSSSEYESTEDADDESNEVELEVGSKNIEQNKTDNLESYDLADVENENSELEDLLNSSDIKDNIENIEETESLVSNPQEPIELNPDKPLELDTEESNKLNNKSIIDEVTLDIILNKYTKRELEALCSNKYLSKSGNKTNLVTRLLENGHDFNESNNADTEKSPVVNN